MYEGFFGLIHLVLVVWAVVNIVKSRRSGTAQVVWSLFVLLFPIIGFIVWLFVGPRSASTP